MYNLLCFTKYYAINVIYQISTEYRLFSRITIAHALTSCTTNQLRNKQRISKEIRHIIGGFVRRETLDNIRNKTSSIRSNLTNKVKQSGILRKFEKKISYRLITFRITTIAFTIFTAPLLFRKSFLIQPILKLSLLDLRSK